MASPLHAARVAVALAWFAALGLAVLIQSNPVVLAGLIGAVVVAAAAAGVGDRIARMLPFAIALAATVCIVNALVTRDGLTVIWRFGDLPILGETNVTLEATVYGTVLGLRAVALVLLGALYALAVDPDELLRLMRRLSFRSALTASIATRMMPVLIRDGRRRAEAQRCRATGQPGRLAMLNATMSGTLNRALDVSATLELRGYSTAVRGPRARRPWSRHDFGFAVSAAMVATIAVLVRVAGLASFSAYPSLHSPVGVSLALSSVALVGAALSPLLDRRGIER